MTIRMRHVPAVVAVLAVAGCGGGRDRVEEAIDVLISGRTETDERALGLADALVPQAPGAAPPGITLALTRDPDDTVTVAVTRDPAGPEFESGASEILDGGWVRAGAEGSGTAPAERVTVYSDIENPVKPLADVFDLDQDNAVAVDFSADSPGVRSPHFPEAPLTGTVTGEYAAEEDLSFPGTFYGLAGTYECTAEPPCEIIIASGGGMSSSPVAWTFTPDVAEGATVVLADGDHLYFGWWLSEPDDPEGDYGFRALSGGSDPFDPGGKFTPGDPDWLVGRAVYRGLAAGRYVKMDFAAGEISGAVTGEFTAQAELTANWGGDDVAVSDHFSISGTVTDFRDVEDGDPLKDWSVDLNRIDLEPETASFGGGATTGAIGEDTTGTGSWAGAFFGNGRDDRQPGSVAGTFDAHLPAARVSGGFGASNTADE